MNDSFRVTLHPDEVTHVQTLYDDVTRHTELRELLRLYAQHGLSDEYVRTVLHVHTCAFGHFMCDSNVYVDARHSRRCRTCRRIRERQRARRRRSAR